MLSKSWNEATPRLWLLLALFFRLSLSSAYSSMIWANLSWYRNLVFSKAAMFLPKIQKLDCTQLCSISENHSLYHHLRLFLLTNLHRSKLETHCIIDAKRSTRSEKVKLRVCINCIEPNTVQSPPWSSMRLSMITAYFTICVLQEWWW